MKRGAKLNALTPIQLRWLGLVPLALFLVRLIDYLRWGTPEHIWWSCHLANAMLALGLCLAQPLLIRVASYWLLIGILPWILDMVNTGIVWPASVISHLGGALSAASCLWHIRAPQRAWPAGLAWFLGLQFITRLVTPPAANVNAAFQPYGPLVKLFPNYLSYWLCNAVLVSLVLWALDTITQRIFPSPRHPAASPPGNAD